MENPIASSCQIWQQEAMDWVAPSQFIRSYTENHISLFTIYLLCYICVESRWITFGQPAILNLMCTSMYKTGQRIVICWDVYSSGVRILQKATNTCKAVLLKVDEIQTARLNCRDQIVKILTSPIGDQAHQAAVATSLLSRLSARCRGLVWIQQKLVKQ